MKSIKSVRICTAIPHFSFLIVYAHFFSSLPATSEIGQQARK